MLWSNMIAAVHLVMLIKWSNMMYAVSVCVIGDLTYAHDDLAVKCLIVCIYVMATWRLGQSRATGELNKNDVYFMKK
jgi:hypothetical protein